ncbi:MAG: histidine kinase dimerization/phosphoacceptor domain -containing protein [Flavobacteriaceae bacterium]
MKKRLFFNYIFLCLLSISHAINGIPKLNSKNNFAQVSIVTDSTKAELSYQDTAKTYITLSDIFKSQYNYKNALEKLHEALRIYKANQDGNGEFYCYLKLAELYRDRTLLKEADAYLKEAEHILKNEETTISETNLLTYYNRKAAIFSEYHRKPDSTLAYSKKVLDLAKTHDNLQMQFSGLMEIGKVYEDEKKLLKAWPYYQQALQIAEQQKNTSNKSNALINIARIYHKNKQLDMAIQTCNKGLEFIKAEQYTFQKFLFYDILQKVYEEKGDKAKAFDYLKERLALTETHYNNLHNDKVLEYENRYDLIEKEKAISDQNRKLAVVEKELEKEKSITAGIVMLAVFISVLVVVSFLYYLKSKSKNVQLEKISKQNEFLLQEANHRINNNLQLIIVLIEDELQKHTGTLEISLPLKKVLAKLDAISTLHRQLYKSEEKSKIEIHDYLMGVKQNFNTLFVEHDVQTNFIVEKNLLPTDTALYLGLLVTELCTNSLKHAFLGQKHKAIGVKLNVENEYILHFEYTDNGQANFSDKDIKPKLIDKLCRQLKVIYKITYQDGFVFNFIKQLD